MTDAYDDIIHLSRPVSRAHPPMSIRNRAAQFAPFAALAGYDAAIQEAARTTQERIQLSENRIDVLNGKLQILAKMVAARPEITVVYFVPDDQKEGGHYVKASGPLQKLDVYDRSLTLAGGNRIGIEDIIALDCDLFATML